MLNLAVIPDAFSLCISRLLAKRSAYFMGYVLQGGTTVLNMVLFISGIDGSTGLSVPRPYYRTCNVKYLLGYDNYEVLA